VSSLQVKLIFDYIHYLYFASSGEWLKAHGYAQQMYRAVMDHQEATQSFSGYFLNACSAYLGTIAVCFGETSEFRRVLKFLKSKIHELDSAHFKVLAQTRIYQFELIVLRRSGDHQKVEKFLPEVVAFVEENGEELEFFKLKFIRFEIAKTYYQLQQRRLATKWFLQSVNPGQHGFSKDIFSFSRILYLINEIESGQTEHIKQSVQQLRAQLKKSGIYGEFETMLLRFISRDYVRYGDLSSTDRMKMFQGFQKELHRFYKSSFGKNFRLYFDFLNWVEEKIQHIER
jgi:tetratricopeptide (TPR) repeat protein